MLFSFSDGIKKLIKSGVKLIIQPGGSIRDKESILVADKAKVKDGFLLEQDTSIIKKFYLL